jgi:circadian clock protein KaiB
VVTAATHDPNITRVLAEPTTPDDGLYQFTLFVSGASDLSARAIADVRDMCDTYLAGRYDLEVVDVHNKRGFVSTFSVAATPTLLKERPLPVRILVGDLSDGRRILGAFDIGVVDGGARER